MEKSPDAFRTISEVADQLETPAHVLRFWESRFPQIKPVKRAGGRRYYRPTDVALLQGIRKLLHDEGMTIRGVQKILREQGVRHVASLSGDDLSEDMEAFDAALDVAAEAPPPAEIVALRDWQEIAAISTEMAAAAKVAPKPADPPEAMPAGDDSLTTAVDMPREPKDQPSLFDFSEPADDDTEGAEAVMPEAPHIPEAPEAVESAPEENRAEEVEAEATVSPPAPDTTSADPAESPALALNESPDVWLPALLRSLSPDARVVTAPALAAVLPRMQALQARLDTIRKTRRG